MVLVSGEAGLGKTTLVAEVARSAFDSGATVLFGHCEEELATPYQLFAEALGHYVTHATQAELVAHVAAHGSELSRLVPALASRVPGLPPTKATDADTERYLLFGAVVGLLATVGADRPGRRRARRPPVGRQGQSCAAPAPGLVGRTAAAPGPRYLPRQRAVARPTRWSRHLAALHRHDGVSRIGLVGLDDTGVMELMEAAAGHGLDDSGVGLAHAIYRETDGNPFFVGEVLRNLVRDRCDPPGRRRAGGWPEATLDVGFARLGCAR